MTRRSAAVVRRSFAPLTKLTGSQWADRYGWIARSSGASESGQYSTDRVSYMREILDVCCDEVHRDVVLNKPAQVGFTEAINQIVGFSMAEDPSGLIVIQPNVEMAKSWVKERIDPMLAESPRLRGIVRSEHGRRTSDDTMQRKIFPGGWLVAVGAQAPSALRSRPARRVLGDERSGWTLDARQQGDPWDLATERTATFWNAKRIQGSTPGEEGTCPITTAIETSDWREYHVSCPACGFTEPFAWKASDGTYRLVCEKGAADEWIPQTARYLCTACGVLIPESEKPRMTRAGQWIPRFPGREVTGFDLNGLISPWRSWADIMRLWVGAQGNAEKLKVFVTHVLAQPWKQRAGERVEAHVLVERVEPTEQLPAPIGALFASIDVQADRLESLIIGAGASEEVWVLEWGQHDGDPELETTWDDAWEHLTAARGARLEALCVDTGFLTDTAWKFVNRRYGQKGVRVLGIKGEDGRGRPWISKPGRVIGKKQRRPWIIGVDTAKDAINLRLKTAIPPGGPGAIHFSNGLESEYFDQLTAEEQRIVLVKGRQTRAWRPIEGRRNEGLDLTVYAMGAMYSMGAAWLATLGEQAAARTAAPPDVQPTQAAGVVLPSAMLPPRGGWVSGWRR